ASSFVAGSTDALPAAIRHKTQVSNSAPGIFLWRIISDDLAAGDGTTRPGRPEVIARLEAPPVASFSTPSTDQSVFCRSQDRPCYIMLKNASLRFLRGGGYWLQSQTLPAVCSENVLPLIRRYCSVPIEGITNKRGNGEVRGQDAAVMSPDNSDSNSEVHHANSTVSARINDCEKQGPRKLHETKANTPVTQASQELLYHGKKLPCKASQPCLLQVVLDTHTSPLRTVLDKWVEDGNCLEGNEARLVYLHLREHRKNRKAFKFVEWIGRGELLNFEEHDYAYHLDSLVRCYGIEAAQKYIERVPKSFRNGVFYETLLASCVHLADVQKAHEVFKEMRNLSLPLTVSACNKMLLLYKNVYKRVARKQIACKKVADIVMLMEKENVKPSSLTYKLLIVLKWRLNDTSDMESVLDMMKANGVQPDFATQTIAAKFYMSRGLTEKAEEAIREMEVYINKRRHSIKPLLDLYAILGRLDDVSRIWKSCREPKLDEYLAAIEAWGKLGCTEEVEKTFEALLQASPMVTSKYYHAIQNLYAKNDLLSKAKEFLERMCSSGSPSGRLTWDAVVNLYVNSGEVEKADSFLLKVEGKNHGRYPLLCSYKKLLKAYAEKGDIHNAGKTLDRLQKRHGRRTWPYVVLLEAYVNANKAPPHRVIERMRANNVPSKTMIELLHRLDNLQKGGDPKITE
ncbi:hypothetical protein EJB05_13442, partial [Eragrostis curvula]